MSTSMTITHNFNNQYVLVQIVLVSTGAVEYCDFTMASANAITLAFASAPSNAAYQVTIVG